MAGDGWATGLVRTQPLPAEYGSDVNSGIDVHICSKDRYSALNLDTEPQDSADCVTALKGCRPLLLQIWTPPTGSVPIQQPGTSRRATRVHSGQEPQARIRRTAPALVGDLLFPRGLRSPADNWSTASVVRGRSTFWTENAVPGPLGRPPSRPPEPAGTSAVLAAPEGANRRRRSLVSSRVPPRAQPVASRPATS